MLDGSASMTAPIGSSILRSVGGKYQTAEVGLAERESPDQPAVIGRAQPGELNQQLRSSLRKGSAARHGPQNERRIGLRPRAQFQAAARTADVHRGAQLHKKSAAQGQPADGKRERGRRSRLAACGAERCCTSRPFRSSLSRNLIRSLRRKLRYSRWTNHLSPAVSYLIGKYSNANRVPKLHENCAIHDLVTAERVSPAAVAAAGLTAKASAMHFLCGTRTFWPCGLPKVTECGQDGFIGRCTAPSGPGKLPMQLDFYEHHARLAPAAR